MKNLLLTSSIAFAVGSSSYAVIADDLAEIVVVGTKASLISSIEKQRDADSFISVVDSDALGEFPDTTAAEAVRRVSGISVENDQGEGRYVTIRGLSADLNTIAVNGALVAAPENGRAVMLDGLPTELLDSIVISKSLTPDQDADSIGGRIDFKTKRPTDLDGKLFKLKLDTQWNEQVDSFGNPKFAVTYGDKIDNASAHVVGLTYSSKDIETFNNETGFGWDIEDDKNFMDDDFEKRYYDLTRERLGLTYDYSHELNEDTLVFVNLFHNEYTDSELRWKDEWGKLSEVNVNEDSATYDRMRHHAETRVREEIRTIQALNFGGETKLGEWDTDFLLSYSYAEENDTDNSDVTFEREFREGKKGIPDDEEVGSISWADPKIPVVTMFGEYSDLAYTPSELEFDEVEFEDAVSKDTELAAKFDFSKDITMFDKPAVAKVGFKYRSREKDVDNDLYIYKFDDKTMADFEPTQLDWQLSNTQTFSQMGGPDAVYALREACKNGGDAGCELNRDKSYRQLEDFTAQEDIFSAYAMATIDFDKTTVVAGLRYEQTNLDSNANEGFLIEGSDDGDQVECDDDAFSCEVITGNVDSSSSHNFLSPSINIKHMLQDNIILRGALWSAVSRPSFKSTTPVLNVTLDEGDVSGYQGNPNLKPYEARNADLSLEWYGENLSMASVGLFYKQIDDAIYPVYLEEQTVGSVEFNDGFKTWKNADESTVKGIEFNIQQEFSEMLPAPFDGLFVALNITLSDAESTFSFDDENPVVVPFRKLADETANFSIGYDKGPWDMRLAMNYRSGYLDYLGDDGDEFTGDLTMSRFTDDHAQWDFKASYDYSDNLTYKFELQNINNEPEYYYWGSDERLSQYDEYGTSASFGVRYKY